MIRLLAIAVVSAAILAYEVLLMRLFAIVQWQHFAYVVISIALLGFGASGSFLALAQDRLKGRFDAAFAVNAALFGLTALGAFALSQELPFNALAVFWDPRQLLYLLVLYALFTLPFFFGANCIGLAFLSFGDLIARIYRYNLIGSGLGALGIVGVLYLLPPAGALRAVAALGLGAAALGCLAGRGKPWRLAAAVLLLAALGLPVAAPESWTDLRISQYKGLSTALLVPDAEVVAQRSSPLGLLSVVESPTVPFRYAPGLSLESRVEPPPQIAIFTDGDGPSMITAFDGRRAPLAYLDYTTSALPYHLLDDPAVLILGAGGGAEVLQALYHDAGEIDAVELNPQVVRLVRETYGDFAGGLYARPEAGGLYARPEAGGLFARPEVRVHVAEARQFVAGSTAAWDLIQIPLLDSFGASAGIRGLSESYLYTIEALQEYLRHLRPGGLLAITRWLKVPPRDALKLFATALVALEREGVGEPARSLALIRGWSTTTLLVKKDAFGAGEIAALGAFARARAFDLAYYPGMDRAEANRANLLDAPYYHDGAMALIGAERDDFLARYKFDIRPASDDRPYFFDFFRWRTLPEVLRLRGQGGAGLLEWGYLVLFATLAQAALLSALLILLPLWLRRRRPASGAPRLRVALYFAALGLAFLFVEIAFIQRFVLFLGHPLTAAAVVIAAFLVFAGLGSGLAPKLAARLDGPRAPGSAAPFPASAPISAPISALGLAVAGIAVIALAYLFLLPPLFERLLFLPALLKGAVSILLIAPLAFFMGLPFPLGLARVSEAAADLVPWAWGVNGCASVMSAVLATILAIHFGFAAVVAAAVALYLAAAFLFHAPLSLTGRPRKP